MKKQQFPKGWDEQRVKQLIAELDARTDEEWVAADEAAAADADDHRHNRTYGPAARNPPATRITQERLRPNIVRSRGDLHARLGFGLP